MPTDVIGDYWKLFPLSWKYSPRPSASGNISNYGEIIFNNDLNISNYWYRDQSDHVIHYHIDNHNNSNNSNSADDF